MIGTYRHQTLDLKKKLFCQKSKIESRLARRSLSSQSLFLELRHEKTDKSNHCCPV